MVSRSSLIVLFAGVTVAAISLPLGAQVPMPVVKTDTSFTPWPARPIGTWDLQVATPDRTVPATLVIADSANQLIVNVRTVEDGEEHRMTITINGTDLTLVGMSPNGVVTLVLRQRDDKITGTWRIGDDQSGTLTGTRHAGP